MRPIPYPKEIYKHYKGKYYEIICLAKDSETEEDVVVYRALYSPYITYVRKLEMFLEELNCDKGEYGFVEFRFTKVNQEEIETSTACEQVNKNEFIPVKGEAINNFKDFGKASTEEYQKACLIEFLDAKTHEAKLGVLLKMSSFITDEMISAMAVSLDLEITDSTTEEKFQSLRKCLSTMQKYEGIRLRD